MDFFANEVSYGHYILIGYLRALEETLKNKIERDEKCREVVVFPDIVYVTAIKRTGHAQPYSTLILSIIFGHMLVDPHYYHTS